jgi:hypothetical protein
MQDWLKTQLANGLPAFAGSSLTGTLSVRQELATELLTELLRDTGTAPRATGSADLSLVAKLVKTIAVRAEDGTVMIDFKISV